MRNLLGWLETRLAQNTLIYIKLAYITLKHATLKLFVCNLSHSMTFEGKGSSVYVDISVFSSSNTISTMYYNISYHILYYTILYYTILYYTILYYTILFYYILYNSILYYTVT